MSCPACDPSLAPSGPRLGAHHFAVRFGDRHVWVSKGGQVIDDCYEVLAGAEGTAWRVVTTDRRVARCDCGADEAAAYIDHGSFSVSTGRPE